MCSVRGTRVDPGGECARTIAIVVGMKQVQLRLPDDLAKRMDTRAQSVGLSRNAWLNKVIEWALEQPVRTVKKEERM